MSCYHPLYAIKTAQGGKPLILGSVDKFSHDKNDFIKKFNTMDISTGELYTPFKIQCQKCIGCRLDYSRQWADRCVMESLEYPQDYNCWITLTYSDANLKYGDRGHATLESDAISSFMKRLRRRFEYKYGHVGIRFYGAGEYGDISLRPHYHVINFNIPLYDLSLIGYTRNGNPLYNSDDVSACWPYGFAVIAEFNWDTAAYTARYVMKKQKGPDASLYYEDLGILPEFVTMSRRPGIGYKYYCDYKDNIYNQDCIILPSRGEQPHISKPPRFFDLMLQEEDPIKYQNIKQRRMELAEQSFNTKLNFTDLDEESFNLTCESVLNNKINSLKRIL